jgi:hypothetical protein
VAGPTRGACKAGPEVDRLIQILRSGGSSWCHSNRYIIPLLVTLMARRRLGMPWEPIPPRGPPVDLALPGELAPARWDWAELGRGEIGKFCTAGRESAIGQTDRLANCADWPPDCSSARSCVNPPLFSRAVLRLRVYHCNPTFEQHTLTPTPCW